MENINDGGGLYDNEGLVDTIILDCNELIKMLFSGRYIEFCATLVAMVQKLGSLKNGIKNEKAAAREQMADLRRMNNDLAEKAYGQPVDRGNENVEC